MHAPVVLEVIGAAFALIHVVACLWFQAASKTADSCGFVGLDVVGSVGDYGEEQQLPEQEQQQYLGGSSGAHHHSYDDPHSWVEVGIFVPL